MFDSNDEGTIWDKMEKKSEMENEYCQDDTPNDGKALFILGSIMTVGLRIIIWMYSACIVKVNATDFVICQTALSGRVQVLDRPGLHFRPFAKTWTFERYSNIKMEDNCMFRDGKPRKIETFIRVQLPETTEARMKLHQRFNGQMHNIEEAVDIVVSNAIRMAARDMDSHYFDVKGIPEIVRLVKAQITKRLADYDLTLSDFGIVNAVKPADEVPQGREKELLDDIAKIDAIKDAIESHQRAKQEAIKDAEDMKDAYLKMHSIDPNTEQAPEVQKK